VYQISRQTDNAFATFTPLRKEEKEKKKTKKLSQLLKVHISETPGVIYLKCEVMTLTGISSAKSV